MKRFRVDRTGPKGVTAAQLDLPPAASKATPSTAASIFSPNWTQPIYLPKKSKSEGVGWGRERMMRIIKAVRVLHIWGEGFLIPCKCQDDSPSYFWRVASSRPRPAFPRHYFSLKLLSLEYLMSREGRCIYIFAETGILLAVALNIFLCRCRHGLDVYSITLYLKISIGFGGLDYCVIAVDSMAFSTWMSFIYSKATR